MQKNNYILFIIFFILSFFIKDITAQTYTSVSDGNFYGIGTWDCGLCIPIPGVGNTIVIKHNIMLDTSYVDNGGSITIDAGASLIQDAPGRIIGLSGNALTNNGIFIVDNVATTGGSFINNDSMRMVLLYSNGVFVNNASISGVDSFLNDDILNNTTNATFSMKKFLNNGNFTNDGIYTCDSLLNTGVMTQSSTGILNAMKKTNDATFTNNGVVNIDSITNSGVFMNSITGTVTNSDFTNTDTFINSGIYNNNALTNIGVFSNYGTYTTDNILLSSGSFYNNALFDVSVSGVNTADFTNDSLGRMNFGAHFSHGSISTNPLLVNEGKFYVDSNWTNIDTVRGVNCAFCIGELTTNTGIMSGSFDFCDKTAPGSPPYIDINSGTFDTLISFCASSPKVIASSSLTICYGDSVQLTVNSGDSYTWNNGKTTKSIFVKTGGDYFATVIDSAGCFSGGSDTLTVTVLPNPVPTITISLDSIFASNGTSYQWYLNDTILSGATSQNIKPSVSGIYYVVISTGTCSRTSVKQSFFMSSVAYLGVSNLSYTIYPNPANDNVKVSLVLQEVAKITIDILDLQGRLIKSLRSQNSGKGKQDFDINVSGFESGLYLLRISSANMATNTMLNILR